MSLQGSNQVYWGDKVVEQVLLKGWSAPRSENSYRVKKRYSFLTAFIENSTSSALILKTEQTLLRVNVSLSS